MFRIFYCSGRERCFVRDTVLHDSRTAPESETTSVALCSQISVFMFMWWCMFRASQHSFTGCCCSCCSSRTIKDPVAAEAAEHRAVVVTPLDQVAFLSRWTSIRALQYTALPSRQDVYVCVCTPSCACMCVFIAHSASWAVHTPHVTWSLRSYSVHSLFTTRKMSKPFLSDGATTRFFSENFGNSFSTGARERTLRASLQVHLGTSRQYLPPPMPSYINST